MTRRAAPEDRPDPSAAGPPAAGTTVAARNDVLLVGRVSTAAQERELPSGDIVCTFRLVVDRPPPARPGTGRPVLVDTLDCAAWPAGLRRTARSLRRGDLVEVTGALRRRFWRAGAGAASRCEVEVECVQRLARAELPVAKRRRAAPAPAPASGTEEAVAVAGPAGAEADRTGLRRAGEDGGCQAS